MGLARSGPPLRQRAGRWHRAAVGVLQRADPVRLALRTPPRPPVTALVCVYRTRNAAVVRDLLAQLPPGAETALWCLDGPVPADLLDRTAGSGPGSRAELLNRLVAGLRTTPEVLVLTDDDVRFEVGDLPALLEAGQRVGLDVWSPAHLASSHSSWDFNRRRRLTFARVTDFVEQGPLLVLSPLGREVVLPLPEDVGMSWGVEVRWWAAARERSARMGIVDAVAVRHLSPPAVAYDRAAAEAVLRAELDRCGLTSLEQLHVVHERVGLRAALRLRH